MSAVDVESFDELESSIESLIDNNSSYTNNIETIEIKYHKLSISPTDLIRLQNGNYLVYSYDDTLIIEYDTKFSFIREIRTINNNPIEPNGLICDDCFNVYVMNSTNNTIYKLNSKLDFVKSFESKRISSYRDIYYYDEKIYAITYNSKEIDTMTLDLELIKSNTLNIFPSKICILEDVMCVVGSDNDYKTYFYKLSSFRKLSEYDGTGLIMPYYKYFLRYSNNFSVFDKNGRLIKEFPLSCGNIKYTDDGMCLMNKKLFLCLQENVIAELKFNFQREAVS
jgi:hypothetical protein